MKNKFFSIVIFTLLISFVFLSCEKNNLSIVTNTNTTISDYTLDIISSKQEKTTEYNKINDIGGGELILHKYRQNYYTIPAPFSKIVDSEEFEKWYSEIILLNPNETNVMMIKEFVLYFDVPKSDFERANLEWAKIVKYKLDGIPMMNPQDFANQETDEVYNADIIYTFDDEIINSYYLSHQYPFVYVSEYEEAIANSEYISQTTDWIDIEQMEAEIIAKYGEAEIVTEITTKPEATESTQSAIPEESETTE